jgi:hypothetical protein
MRQDLSVGQRVLRSVGLTIMLMTAVFFGMLTVSYSTAKYAEGWRQALIVLSLVLAVVATLAMLADSFDLWMLGRRITAFSVRMIHSLVFVSVLAAVVLSLVTRTSGLLLVLTPTLVLYLFTVVKPPARAGSGSRAAPRSGARAPGGSRSQSGRQRRGGKKRK